MDTKKPSKPIRPNVVKRIENRMRRLLRKAAPKK